LNEPRSGGDGLRGWARLMRALRVGSDAFVWGWKHEEALRWEIVACAIALPAAWLLGQNGIERALLWGTVVFVFIVELLNTAVEVAIDRISTDHHELSGLAKDLGSLAVGVSIVLAMGVWLFVLLGR
jgi:diacylglycerol kinase (ATP)